MPPNPVSYADAAHQVLRAHSKGAPLHYRSITDIAIDEGLIKPGGRTPEASMNATITQDIKRRERAGRNQRFKAHGRGMYSLAVPTGPLGGAVNQRNQEVRRRLRVLLAELDPREFEALIGELLVALGFEGVEVTRYSGDGGIDVRGTLSVGGVTEVETAIQVKRWMKNVSGRTVRELRGALGPTERGLIITLSSFTRDARKEGAAENRTPVSLLDGEQLIDLLVDLEIGVRRRRVDIYEIDEGAFFPTDSDEAADTHEPRARRRVAHSPLMSEKALSVWPLPGGRYAWKESLDTMLQHVADNGPTTTEAIAWLIDTFERTSSEKVARGYWQVLRSFGLIETSGESLGLTVVGSDYLSDTTSEALLAVMRSHAAGFDEIIDLLRPAPRTAAELLQGLRDHLGVTWETDAQVGFRLGWLENVAAAEPIDHKWRLIEA